MRRYGNKRDASEPGIVAALEQLGASVERMDKPVDLLIGFRRVTVLAECKTPGTQYGKRLNQNQQGFADRWRGSPIVVLHSPDDAIRLIRNIAAISAAGAA